jgi:hypothetical protein
MGKMASFHGYLAFSHVTALQIQNLVTELDKEQQSELYEAFTEDPIMKPFQDFSERE